MLRLFIQVETTLENSVAAPTPPSARGLVLNWGSAACAPMPGRWKFDPVLYWCIVHAGFAQGLEGALLPRLKICAQNGMTDLKVTIE
jgi:hypothetical protein